MRIEAEGLRTKKTIWILIAIVGLGMQIREIRSDEPGYADLPFEITSFGAARIGGSAYLYGGHTGSAHSYSTKEQSNRLLALDLASPERWEEIAHGEKLQGLAMVGYQKQLIVVGGFTAKNAAGEEHDLHSQSSVRAFDIEKQSWSDLPSLPEGRSSHDACLEDGVIYVVGGWTMDGEKETVWHKTALSLDLSRPQPQWEELPTPPFTRRALATVFHDGKLYVLGGMNEHGGPTKEVAIYDPKSKKWSLGPELIGQSPMTGFGAAGCSYQGKLIVSTYEGKLLQLSEDSQTWKELGQSKNARFFHRLIPLDSNRLLAVGGASMEIGKFLELEVLSLEP